MEGDLGNSSACMLSTRTAGIALIPSFSKAGRVIDL